MQGLKVLKRENVRLKSMYADQAFELTAIKIVLTRIKDVLTRKL